jgi:hypothetical protein
MICRCLELSLSHLLLGPSGYWTTLRLSGPLSLTTRPSFYRYVLEEQSFEANPLFVPENDGGNGGQDVQAAIEQTSEGSIVLDGDTGIGMRSSVLSGLEGFAVDARASSVVEAAVTKAVAASSPLSSKNKEPMWVGAQHTQATSSQDCSVLLRPSSWNTAVLLLQNDAGSHRWPVETQQLEDLVSERLCVRLLLQWKLAQSRDGRHEQKKNSITNENAIQATRVARGLSVL